MMRRFVQGFTLVELMIVLAITIIVIVMAVPAFTEHLARRRLEGAVNEFSSDLQFSRTEAVSKNKQVSLVTAADGSSYTINYAGTVTPALKTVDLPRTITLSPAVSVTYDPLRGMVTSATQFTLSSSQISGTVRASIESVGRIRLCSPGNTFMSYPPCT